MRSPLNDALLHMVEERRRGYQLIALAIVACWPMDIVVLGRLPWDSLAIRLAWAVVFLAPIAWAKRNPERMSSSVPLVIVGSSVAMGALMLRTGGSASPLFWMLPFLPVMAAQLEPEKSRTLHVSVFVIFSLGLVALVSEGKSPITMLAWGVGALFLGWWAGYWLERLRVRRTAMIAAERVQAELERERARVLEELALAEQRRGSAERLAAVGQLAAGVAHEVNNPLASLKSNLEYLLHDDVPAAERRDVLADSLLGVERIRQIVEDLRSFAREPSTALEEVDARAAIAEACRIASIRLRVLAVVERHVEEGLPHLRCDRARLVQVLVNLLVNAAEAIESAGRTIDGRVIVRARAAGDGLEISVEDNGAGVCSSVVDRLFEPFVTTKASGRGIGLALSREYAVRIGGTLCADAGNLGGARFTLSLPLVQHARGAA